MSRTSESVYWRSGSIGLDYQLNSTLQIYQPRDDELMPWDADPVERGVLPLDSQTINTAPGSWLENFIQEEFSEEIHKLS